MSKTSGHRQRRKDAGGGRAATRTSDGSIYFGLIIIGAAVVGIAFLLEPKRLPGPAVVVYCALMAWLVNRAAWTAYRGRRMARWQQSLARLPLRCVGYGTRGGKPIEAAHNQPAARRVIVMSVVFSVVVLAGLAILLMGLV